MAIHTHPMSGAQVIGALLPPGACICVGDLYDSTNGKWEPADQCAGMLIESGHVAIVVRPYPESLSKDARTLLCDLCDAPWPTKTPCIGVYEDARYIIPGPNFNWDDRIDWRAQQVECPECIDELVAAGYLAPLEEVPLVGSDHWGPLNRNKCYVLTEAGERVGAVILLE